ncbi:ATPase, AAA family [Ancylostoma duodenale]|uniref:ATPase, AAA family n=1 Tax=Ancylostoma duodenale TaxID=51022 RepID=A0A0C2GAC2_9BILA|nr:ATPase, AAA family [Ancylostoma duodenale]
MTDRAEVISLCIRLAAAAALSFFTVRYMVKFLDPHYATREETKKRVAQLFRELGLSESIELNEHEMRIATQFVGGEDVGAEWSDIGGCDELIADLKDRVILPLQIAAEADCPLLCPPKGILLYGPPGCGKTLLAKAVARAAGCRFINLQVSNLTDKWYGESQKLAAAVFSVAQKFQPTIIFIDEIDSFLRDRQANDHEATAMMKAQFMSLWDGFSSTNDQVILREERLADDVDLQKIAAMGVGLSGSDLKEVCRLAVLARAKATLADQGSLKNRQPIQSDDLEHALMKYSRAYQQMTEHGLD